VKEKKGISPKQVADAVDEALLKRTRGEKLDKREELILAYGYYAPRCHHRHDIK
jgi:hypothetical protein